MWVNGMPSFWHLFCRHSLESRQDKSYSYCPSVEGQGQAVATHSQAGVLDCMADHLFWGRYSHKHSWRGVPISRCQLVKISQDLWVKFILKPLKLVIQTEERLVVSPEEYAKSRGRQCSTSARAGDEPQEIWGQARPLPWAADSHLQLPGEHFCWNVPKAPQIQSVSNDP